jgi:hypothetical protein
LEGASTISNMSSNAISRMSSSPSWMEALHTAMMGRISDDTLAMSSGPSIRSSSA